MASVYARPPSGLVNNAKARPMTAGGTLEVTDYPLPRNSLPPKSPSFSFSKDKSRSINNSKQKMPGPGEYEMKSCFATPKVKSHSKSAFGSKGERKNFLDDIIRTSKMSPGPGHFNPKIGTRIVGGMNVKGYRSSFLDE